MIWVRSGDDPQFFQLEGPKGDLGGFDLEPIRVQLDIIENRSRHHPPKSSSGLRVMIWGEMAIQAQIASGMMYRSFYGGHFFIIVCVYVYVYVQLFMLRFL